MSVCKHKHIFAWHSERVYVRACSCFRMCLATIGSGWFAHACTCIEPKQSKFVRTMRTLISLNLCDLTYVLTTTAYLHTYAHIATKHACTHRHTHKLWLLYSNHYAHRLHVHIRINACKHFCRTFHCESEIIVTAIVAVCKFSLLSRLLACHFAIIISGFYVCCWLDISSIQLTNDTNMLDMYSFVSFQACTWLFAC